MAHPNQKVVNSKARSCYKVSDRISTYEKYGFKGYSDQQIDLIRKTSSGTLLSRQELSYLEHLKNTTKSVGLKIKASKAVRNKMIFTINVHNADLVRRALIDRGWIEKISPNLSKISKNKKTTNLNIQQRLERLVLSNLVKTHPPNFVWDLKDYSCCNRTNKSEIANSSKSNNNNTQKINAIRNQFRVEALWSSEQGLYNCSKESIWYYIENVSEINAPRMYTNFEIDEREEFIQDYQLTACTSLLKWILTMLANNIPIFIDGGNVSTNVMVFAINRCKEYVFKKQNRDIDCDIERKATTGQWNTFFRNYYILTRYHDVFRTDSNCKLPLLIGYSKILLKQIHEFRPQLSCEGFNNIWVMKPTDPRDRKIKLVTKLGVIIDWLSCAPSAYVIQKYIEEPLLIYDTKFEIRQYYLITSIYPLEIWIYKDCYLRFSSQKYTVRSLHESIHQTSFVVQRKYKNCSGRHHDLPRLNMWSLSRYKEYLEKIDKGSVWDKCIYPGMKKAIVGVMLSSQASMPFPQVFSKRRFGLYGCDFVLDKEYRPWLVEIKACPDLNPTNDFTSKFCREFIQDVFKVVIDHAQNPKASTGNFKCIYRQQVTAVQQTQLLVKGHKLPLDYFCREITEAEIRLPVLNIPSSEDQQDAGIKLKKQILNIPSSEDQQDVGIMLKKPIFNIPSCEDQQDVGIMLKKPIFNIPSSENQTGVEIILEKSKSTLESCMTTPTSEEELYTLKYEDNDVGVEDSKNKSNEQVDECKVNSEKCSDVHNSLSSYVNTLNCPSELELDCASGTSPPTNSCTLIIQNKNSDSSFASVDSHDAGYETACVE